MLSTMFRSSRMFPGHEYAIMTLSAEAEIPLNSMPFFCDTSSAKYRPKPSVAYLRLQVLVRRGNHPNVDMPRDGRADTKELAVLENTQQLHLRYQRQLANLVEKQSTTVGQLEIAFALIRRTRK